MNGLLVAMMAVAMFVGSSGTAHAEQAQADAGGKRHEKLVFPMKADDFQKRIDERLAKIKTKVETKLTKKQVPAEKAKAIRARLDSSAAQVTAATKRVTADGVVTEDEAKQVRQKMRAMRAHKRGGHKSHEKREAKS